MSMASSISDARRARHLAPLLVSLLALLLAMLLARAAHGADTPGAQSAPAAAATTAPASAPSATAATVDKGARDLMARLPPSGASTRQTVKVTAGQYLAITLPLAPPDVAAAPPSQPVPAPAAGAAQKGMPVAGGPAGATPGTTVEASRAGDFS